jgi:hypothetical protein
MKRAVSKGVPCDTAQKEYFDFGLARHSYPKARLYACDINSLTDRRLNQRRKDGLLVMGYHRSSNCVHLVLHSFTLGEKQSLDPAIPKHH